MGTGSGWRRARVRRGPSAGRRRPAIAGLEQLGAGGPAPTASAGRRPTTSSARSSRRRAWSLTTRIRRSGSTATTPSRMPCSIASRSCSSAAISRSSSPNVWRLSRRASSSEAPEPGEQRDAGVGAMAGTSVPSCREPSLRACRPTPGRRSRRRPPRNGTLARPSGRACRFRPRAPCRPASASGGGADPLADVAPGFGCE